MVGCQLRTQKQAPPSALKVEVQEITEQKTISLHTYVGQIEEKSSVSISSQTSGRILSLHTARGKHVQAGQLLLSIDSTQAVNARQAAEAALHQAEDGYARALVLYQEGGLTEQNRVEIESKLAQARSMYATAQQMVTDCRVVAPVSGLVSECRAQVGENVLPGMPLLTLMSTDGFTVRFAVPEMEIAHIHTGELATIEVEAIGLRDLPLVITEKSLIPNKIAHTYDITASIEQHPDMMPGMMCKVTLQADVVTGYVLPQNCIQILPDGAKVWVARDNRAQRTTVSIGQYAGDGVLVTGGLKEGDKVITKGYQKLWQSAEITY